MKREREREEGRERQIDGEGEGEEARERGGKATSWNQPSFGSFRRDLFFSNKEGKHQGRPSVHFTPTLSQSKTRRQRSVVDQ